MTKLQPIFLIGIAFFQIGLADKSEIPPVLTDSNARNSQHVVSGRPISDEGNQKDLSETIARALVKCRQDIRGRLPVINQHSEEDFVSLEAFGPPVSWRGIPGFFCITTPNWVMLCVTPEGIFKSKEVPPGKSPKNGTNHSAILYSLPFFKNDRTYSTFQNRAAQSLLLRLIREDNGSQWFSPIQDSESKMVMKNPKVIEFTKITNADELRSTTLKVLSRVIVGSRAGNPLRSLEDIAYSKSNEKKNLDLYMTIGKRELTKVKENANLPDLSQALNSCLAVKFEGITLGKTQVDLLIGLENDNLEVATIRKLYQEMDKYRSTAAGQ